MAPKISRCSRKEIGCKLHRRVAPCKRIEIPKSGKFLFVASGMRENLLVECGILGFGTRNTRKGIWNPTNDWNPESKFH